jgi:hypothetical protein
MINRYKLVKADNGKYYAQLKDYPNIGNPDSYGTRNHAMTYIANSLCLTLPEYREAVKAGYIK